MLTYHLSPEKYRAAIEYRHTLAALHFAGAVFEFALLAALLYFHVGPYLRNFAEKVSSHRWRQALVFVPTLLLIVRVAELPLSLYRHRLSVKVGISIQPWLSWLGDWSTGLAIEIVVATLALWGLFALVRRSPQHWWAWASLAAIPLAIGAVYLAPIVIDPLFNHFQPLRESMVAPIQEVARTAGLEIPASRMYEMKAGEKLTAVNAYLTGFGPSQRIVIWDTTIKALTIPQIQSVFAHEAGHYRLQHIPIGLAIGVVVTTLIFFVLDRVLRPFLTRFGGRLDIRGLADWAVLPAAMLLLGLLGFFTEPAMNGFVLHQEKQADLFELHTMRHLRPDAGRISAEVDQIMGEIDLDDPEPSPFVKFWLYDHPWVGDRMQFAQEAWRWDKP